MLSFLEVSGFGFGREKDRSEEEDEDDDEDFKLFFRLSLADTETKRNWGEFDSGARVGECLSR